MACVFAAADETFHEPGDDPRWHEAWWFDFATPDAAMGGWVRVLRFPNERRAAYHAFFGGTGRQLLAVVDDGIRLGASLEFRADGLWGDHICETAFEHWTVGLEAFALGVDDPADVVADGYGDRVPLGFDLEWECTGGPVEIGWAEGYRQASRVSGEILIGAEELDVDCVGMRMHTWGVADWWTGSSNETTAIGADGVEVIADGAGDPTMRTLVALLDPADDRRVVEERTLAPRPGGGVVWERLRPAR